MCFRPDQFNPALKMALKSLETLLVRDFSSPHEWKHFCLVLSSFVRIFATKKNEEEEGCLPILEFTRNLLAKWADHHRKDVFRRMCKAGGG